MVFKEVLDDFRWDVEDTCGDKEYFIQENLRLRSRQKETNELTCAGWTVVEVAFDQVSRFVLKHWKIILQELKIVSHPKPT